MSSSISQVIAASVRGAGFALVWLMLSTLPVAAQTVAGQNGAFGPEGDLLPDFLRTERERDEAAEAAFDPFSPPAPRKKSTTPQDPLDDRHRSFTSQGVDERDRQRQQDPLTQPPATFREDGSRQLSSFGDWRDRDRAAFDPLGIRRGGLVFLPELHSSMKISDNVFASWENQKSDVAARLSPTLRILSDWNVHELELSAKSEHTRWRNFTTEDTDEYELKARGRVDVSYRTQLEAGARLEQKSDGRGSPEQPAGARTPALTHQQQAYGQLNHRFNRLGFRLRGSLARHTHDDVELIDGTLQRNDVKDFDEKRLELRTSYEFSPRLQIFVDTERHWRDFVERRDEAGFLQGSDGWLLAAGVKVELTSNLELLGRAGYVLTDPDEASHAEISGLFVDAEMIWRPTRLTALSFDVKTEVEETIQPDSAGALKHTYGVTLEHDWTRRFSTQVMASYEVQDYAGIDQIERELTMGAGFDYTLGRILVLDGSFEHVRYRGDSKYDENIYQLGMKLRR